LRFRSRVCPYLRCRNSGGPPGGVREKYWIACHINLQAFYPAFYKFWSDFDAKYTNISRRNQVSMALFISAIIHQGDELFSVHSRGKQCAFLSLSALLTARNTPLTAWSFTTFNNREVKMPRFRCTGTSSVILFYWCLYNSIILFLFLPNIHLIIYILDSVS
jgi:hypothetical protein